MVHIHVAHMKLTHRMTMTMMISHLQLVTVEYNCWRITHENNNIMRLKKMTIGKVESWVSWTLLLGNDLMRI